MIRWKVPLYKILVEKDDIKNITNVVQRGMHWAEGPEIEEFENALKDYVGGITRKYGPDPRNGIDYLDGIYLINQSNGINDFYELDKAYKPRAYGMMGWDPEKTAFKPYYKIQRDAFLKDYIKEYFGNEIEVREGYYSSAPSLTNHLKDTMTRVARSGYRKIVLTKPIADHNIYANNYWDLRLSYQSLCRAGFDKNNFDILK